MFDYIKLADLLPGQYTIVLVGLTVEQISSLPRNIIGIKKINIQMDLAFLYSIASVVTSLSYSETFGLSIVEGMACGTPAVIYDNSGQSALVTDNVGKKVKTGSIESVRDAIVSVVGHGKERYSKTCRDRVMMRYDKNTQYLKYLDLYKRLIDK